MAELATEQRIAKEDYDWGHLRPNEFRMIFIPRHELREPGHADSESSDDASSVSSTDTEEAEEDERRRAAAARVAGSNERNADRGGNQRQKSMVSRFREQEEQAKKRAEEAARGPEDYEAEAAAYRERKLQRKLEKKRRLEEEDETPDWAKACGWRLLLRGVLEEAAEPPDVLDGQGVPMIVPPPVQQATASRDLVGRVVSFLNPRSIGKAVRLSRGWATVGYEDPLYYCLVQVGVPSVTIYAFEGRVDAVVHCGASVLASGDKGVSAFHVDTGEFLGRTAIRDTTAIPRLFVAVGSLWSCSRNGAIREWSLPHDVRNIEFRAQMWEHNAEINDLTSTVRNPRFGGSTTETPRLVSCADDRSVRVWNPVRHHCDAVLRPFNHKSATMRSVYVSSCHLYVGSSDGIVYVYGVDGTTRSLFNRQKKRVGVERTYPLEAELDNGDEVVGAIALVRENTTRARLLVASWDGFLRVWAVPLSDLEFYLVHTLQHHARRINDILVAQRHFVTASDDGTLRYYGLFHGDDYENALERRVECGARVKCVAMTPGDPGVVLAGLADGRVLVFELGKSM